MPQRPCKDWVGDSLAFSQEYKPFFRLRTRDASSQARRYLSGLLQATRRNVQRMAEIVLD